MNIKKVDDKPMVIHTKEKPKLKIKGAPETKIKGRNVLTVRHEPKIAGSSTEKSVVENGRIKLKKSPVHVADKRKTGQTTTAVDGMEYKGRNGTVQDRKAGRTAYEQGRSGSGNVQDRKGNATVQDRGAYGTVQGRKKSMAVQDRQHGRTAQGANADTDTRGRRGKEQEVRQSVNRENRMYAKQTGVASYRKTKAQKEAAVKKKSAVPPAVVSVAAKSALDEMDGGNEVYEAYMAADTLTKPATNALDAGRNLYRSKAAKEKQQNGVSI